jgi:phosphomannomutase
MIMDFYAKQLRATGLWNDHPRFVITTTPSSRAWDEWVKRNGLKILTVPVGFKEIAYMMRKVENQLITHPEKEVVINDIWREGVNIGTDPRLFFAGEESGGMIFGPEKIIESKGGREAIAMREKSAGESSIIATAFAAHLFLKKKSLSDHLQDIFRENKIVYKYYFRADIVYYNESEPDPVKMAQEKKEGEIKRDQIDIYCLGLAFGLKEKMISIDQAKEILAEGIPGLDYSGLRDIKFVGDATYFEFKNMFVQVRKSGTDAKLRGYSNGDDKERTKQYLDKLVHYSGGITPRYEQYISKSFRDGIYDKVKKIYQAYLFWGL